MVVLTSITSFAGFTLQRASANCWSTIKLMGCKRLVKSSNTFRWKRPSSAIPEHIQHAMQTKHVSEWRNIVDCRLNKDALYTNRVRDDSLGEAVSASIPLSRGQIMNVRQNVFSWTLLLNNRTNCNWNLENTPFLHRQVGWLVARDITLYWTNNLEFTIWLLGHKLFGCLLHIFVSSFT